MYACLRVCRKIHLKQTFDSAVVVAYKKTGGIAVPETNSFDDIWRWTHWCERTDYIKRLWPANWGGGGEQTGEYGRCLFGPNPTVDPAVVPDNTITVCVDT